MKKIDNDHKYLIRLHLEISKVSLNEKRAYAFFKPIPLSYLSHESYATAVIIFLLFFQTSWSISWMMERRL